MTWRELATLAALDDAVEVGDLDLARTLLDQISRAGAPELLRRRRPTCSCGTEFDWPGQLDRHRAIHGCPGRPR